jgi:hypothetical protein
VRRPSRVLGVIALAAVALSGHPADGLNVELSDTTSQTTSQPTPQTSSPSPLATLSARAPDATSLDPALGPTSSPSPSSLAGRANLSVLGGQAGGPSPSSARSSKKVGATATPSSTGSSTTVKRDEDQGRQQACPSGSSAEHVTICPPAASASPTDATPPVVVVAPPATQPPTEPDELVSWQAEQRPSTGGVEQADRIQEVAAPGPVTGRPSGSVLRFELRPGDVQDSSGYLANRVEVYGRTATPMSTPASQWPDPVGSVRWYTLSLYVPSDFVTATDSTWLTFTQWKGLNGGSPPVALEIKRDHLRLGGTRTNEGLLPNDGDLGQVAKGSWTTLAVGLSLSTDSNTGWVEVLRDGHAVLPRTHVATMDLIDGRPDPIYLKQGIYRDPSWTSTHVLYMGPVRVGSARPAALG